MNPIALARATHAFELGSMCITPAARDALASRDLFAGVFLTRHVLGDFGDLDADAVDTNVRERVALSREKRPRSRTLGAPGGRLVETRFTSMPDGGALYVRFHSGATYRYPGAGDEHHAAMIATESPGKYHRGKILGRLKGERIS